MEKQRYYISTAIAYTSGKPHIGNTYEVVLADAIARFKRQQGYDVYFQTGTHGRPQSGHLPSTSWDSVKKDSHGVQYIPS